MRASLFVLLLGTLPGRTVAQEYPDFTAGMKYADAASKALTKLEQKTGPEAVGAAERLGAVYETMIAFWRQRNAANAVKWSEEGKAAAVQLANAAHAGDAGKAAALFKALSETCQSCHDAYREKSPGGKYRFKTKPAAAERPRA